MTFSAAPAISESFVCRPPSSVRVLTHGGRVLREARGSAQSAKADALRERQTPKPATLSWGGAHPLMRTIAAVLAASREGA
jgi:hypothetical protein